MRQLIIEVKRILWTWFKDHDDYNYRNTQLYSLTKKKIKKQALKVSPSLFANMPDFSQNVSITLSDLGYSGLIITILNFL